MPKKSYKVNPPHENKNIIKLPKLKKMRLPLELRRAAFSRKAGPMGGRKRPEADPFAYCRGEAEAETREILAEQSGSFGEKEKGEKPEEVLADSDNHDSVKTFEE